MIRLVVIIIIFVALALIKGANPTNASVAIPLMIFVWFPLILIMGGVIASYFIHPPGKRK